MLVEEPLIEPSGKMEGTRAHHLIYVAAGTRTDDLLVCVSNHIRTCTLFMLERFVAAELRSRHDLRPELHQISVPTSTGDSRCRGSRGCVRRRR